MSDNNGEGDGDDGTVLAPRALVAGHGEFAIGIVSAVEQITGRGRVLVALTNRGLGADEIVRTLRDAVASAGAHVIFTDLPAGSWTIAARRLQRDRPDVVVVTGANLPALLDFVFQTHCTNDEAARHSADKGRGAMVVLGSSGGSAGGAD
jgi:PTS system N-acetylgalactosamine-specific IIA component